MANQIKHFFEFERFQMDVRNRVLLCDGKPVALTPKAFDVLLVFVQRPGELLAKDQLLKSAWPGTNVGPKVVSVCIAGIRRALGGDRQQYISTASKSGYRFVAEVRERRESDESPRGVQTDLTNPGSNEQEVEEDQFEQRSPQKFRDIDVRSFGRSRASFVGVLRKSCWQIARSRFRLLVLTAMGVIALGIYFRISGNARQSVLVNRDGSWTVTVPVIENGIILENRSHRFEVSAGDVIEIVVTGQADIGRGPVGPEGEPGYRDNSMDGPFKDHVGGLEMWVGPDKKANRYLVGAGGKISVQHSGVITFRVIESVRGYHDGDDSGSFQVTVKKADSAGPLPLPPSRRFGLLLFGSRQLQEGSSS